MKLGTSIVLAFLLAGCVSNGGGQRAWEWKATDRTGYTRASTAEGTAPLVARAEADFRVLPAFPEYPPMPLYLAVVAHHQDGRTLLSFRIGAVSDVEAVYIFNAQGEIVDRYLHSYWGVTTARPSTRRR